MENIKAILIPNPVLPNHVVKIDPNKCIACYQCAKSCRCNVLMENFTPGQPPILVYPEECWHCAVCTEHCPTGAIQFEHPINQKITWKCKDTGELFRIGMKNPPPAVKTRACGDRGIYIGDTFTMTLKVKEITKLTRYVNKVVFEAPEGTLPEYKPGHFCNVKISEDSHRAYSIGNMYNGTTLELYIDTFSGGKGVTYISNLTVGGDVQVSMPFGQFIYTPQSQPLFLVAGVTGMSPIKAILEQELNQDKLGRKIHLVFQIWDEEDNFMADFLGNYAEVNKNFTYKVIKANPESGDVKLQDYIEASEFITEDVQAYLCGSDKLIKSVERCLFDKGVFWRNMFYESFV